jgi:hypothetical protein
LFFHSNLFITVLRKLDSREEKEVEDLLCSRY